MSNLNFSVEDVEYHCTGSIGTEVCVRACVRAYACV